jgi:hypothetical protein
MINNQTEIEEIEESLINERLWDDRELGCDKEFSRLVPVPASFRKILGEDKE